VSSLPYRLCAIDLDDTLLGPDHAVSPRNAAAVRAVVALGVTVVIASGRMHEATLRFVEQMGLETPIISYNGAMVKNPHTGEVWLHERIAGDVATAVLEFAHANSLQLNYYLNDHFYSAAYTSWAKLYHDRTQAPIELLPEMYETLPGTEPTKMIIVDSKALTDSLLAPFQERFGDRLYVTKSNDEYLEMMPPQANKGVALAMVAAKFGITAAETIAFGDSYNDIPMLNWAGLSIAVGNAKPETRAAAKQTVATNAEDGVGIALEQIFHLDISR
jgi:Cof subfamily protein (haloacid dehalogenase superfamily)